MSLKNTSQTRIIEIDKDVTYVYLSYYNTFMKRKKILIIPPSEKNWSTVTSGLFTYSHERVSLFSTQNLVTYFPDKKKQFGPLPATPVLLRKSRSSFTILYYTAKSNKKGRPQLWAKFWVLTKKIISFGGIRLNCVCQNVISGRSSGVCIFVQGPPK